MIALAEDPPTPLWELVLEQFKDQLVLILLGSATVSFVLALFEDGDDWTAFVDPAVVCFVALPLASIYSYSYSYSYDYYDYYYYYSRAYGPPGFINV